MLIVGTPGGGIWRKTDSPGSSWVNAGYYGLGDASILHLEWDVLTGPGTVYNPGTLYALTWNTLKKSTNNGDTWTALLNSGAMPMPLLPNQFGVVDPKPFAQLKFSSTESVILASLPCRGFFYSFDGTNFSQYLPSQNGFPEEDNCIAAIAGNSITKQIYFSTLTPNYVYPEPPRIYRSISGWAPDQPDLHFELDNKGLPNNRLVASIASAARRGETNRMVVAVADPFGIGEATKLYLKSAIGEWVERAKLPIFLLPRPLLYVSLDELFLGDKRSYHTLNMADPGSRNPWTKFFIPNEQTNTRSIYFDTVNHPGKLWTANDGAGNTGSMANVTRWNWTPGSAPSSGSEIPEEGLSAWQAHYAGVVVTDDGKHRVFVGEHGNGAVCFEDASDDLGGYTSSGAPNSQKEQIAIQFSLSDPNFAYARTKNCGWFQRTNNARDIGGCNAVIWNEVFPSGGANCPPDYWSRHIIGVHHENTDRVYFVNKHDISVSTNAGNSFDRWTFPYGSPVSIYVAYCEGQDCTPMVIVGTENNGAYSTFDGAIWEEWGLNPCPTCPDPPEVVLAIAGLPGSVHWWMATTDGLYRKIYGISDWQRVTGGNGYIVNDVALHPYYLGMCVYAAFGYGGVRQQHRGGIRVSSDHGDTWSSITAIESGIPIHQAPITDVELDPLGPHFDPHFVYAASYGRGLWFYDWGTALPAGCGGS